MYSIKRFVVFVLIFVDFFNYHWCGFALFFFEQDAAHIQQQQQQNAEQKLIELK